MTRISGQLKTADGDTAAVEFKVDEETLRIRSGRRPIGAWQLDEIDFERVSLFRFRMVVEDQVFQVIPDDPTAFAKAVGAMVDLREGRYGLSARLEQAARQPSR